MTNNLNEKRNYAVIIAAIVCTLILMVGGLTTGLVFAVRQHNEQATVDEGRQMAQYLLQEAANELRHSMSALRLCNEKEPAETISRTALVHAVRAETALECRVDEWADSRSKEAFLNDIATVLHSYEPEKTIELSEKLYEYAAKFYDSVTRGDMFEYDGELIDRGGGEDHATDEITQEDKDEARKLVESALETSRVELVGVWNGHIEFYTERNDGTGYAVVCNGKIIEYSFTRADGGNSTDIETAEEVALETAQKCGYRGLKVKWSENVGRSVAVIMCKEYGGAIATDDCATAVVYNGTTVAFSAGGCEHKHENIPQAKRSESEARKATESGEDGTLVVRTVNGKERICYEYRYELDDGVHYVYVCAESGKQMEVK